MCHFSFKRVLFFAVAVTFSIMGSASDFKENSMTSLQNKIESYLTKASKNGFSGAVLVAQNNQVVFNRGFGFADRSNQTLFTPTTIVDTGSVTKQFTAAGILKLQELNKLSVNDQLSQYFEKLPADKQAITIHQLLTHSSGLVGGIGNGDFDHIPTEEYFKRLFDTKLLHPIGSKHYYSNAGYSVLARIIELVAKQEYESFIKQYLFKPAGMTATGYLAIDWQKHPQAKGYQYSIFDVGSMVKRYRDDGKISWVLKGNGGINSTQEDMFRWYKALNNNQVLSAESFKQFTTGYIKEYDDGDSQYAYGWAVFNSKRNTKVVAHNGSNGVFFYDYVMFPDEETLILFVTNGLTRPQYGMANAIEAILFNPETKVKDLKPDPLMQILQDTIAFKGDFDKLPSIIQQKYAKALTRKHYLNRLGIALQKNNYLDQAIALFQLNVKLFDDDGNLWDSLGEAYFAKKDYQLASNAFSKALDLKPEQNCYWCENSEDKLARSKKHLSQ